MGDVIDLNKFRKKNSPHATREWQEYIRGLGRMELLDEMVKFQEERAKRGKLDQDMATRGITLFHALHQIAYTPELRAVASSYLRHLEEELKVFRSQK